MLPSFFISEFNSRHDSGIMIGVVHVAAGSAGVVLIAIVVVASILIFICVRRSKKKRMLIYCSTLPVFKIATTF